MNISIFHQLIYTYSNEVALDPHKLYLFPKLNESLALKKYNLEIIPKPSHMYENIDLEGNIQTVAFFSEKTSQLTITAQFEVETLPFNPFDFVFFPFAASQLPFEYEADETAMLMPYLEKNGVTTLIDQTAREIAAQAGWSTSQFLMDLCAYINKNFEYNIREEGLPNAPEYTLLNKQGSCRDYAVFFISCCKALGLASRFVSGYHFSESLSEHYLHAWVEVYLPGGGWRAFDPTQNNAVSNLHIPMASSIFPEKIGPVSGTYRGKSNSALKTEVIVKARL